MRRTTFTAFGAVFVATIAMLGTVNGRVYQTNDSIVFEIDRTSDGVFLAKSFPRSQSDFVPLKTFLNGGMVPNWHIPLVVPNPQVNSYSIGLPPRQGLTFYSWLHHPFGYGGAYPVPAIGSTAGQTLKSETKQKSACHFGRIASGTEAKPNSWPFMVAFMSAIDRRVECGGSLISENKILTAANCFEQLSMFEISILVVRLGMHTTGEFYGQPHDAQMTRRISRVAIHKAYNAQNSYYDIAVLTMDTPVTFSKAISPVCLPTASNNVDIFAGKTGQIMGWGDLETGATCTLTLHEASVPILTNAQCRAIYPDPDKIADHMLCTSADTSGACPGDRGGPIVVKSATDNRWCIAGVISWGNGCDKATYPAGVYTKVTLLRSWINQNMRN